METVTEQREEADQDESSSKYASIPTQFLYGTGTFTDEREERDQDKSNHAYMSLPVDSRVQV